MIRRLAALLIVIAAIGAGFFYFTRGSAPDLLATNTVAVMDGSGAAMDVYFNLENIGGPDALVAVFSTAAHSAVIVRPDVYSVTAIPAQSNPVFAYDGVYLRLEGLQGDLKEGALIPVVLTFERAGDVAIKARVSGDVVDPHAQHRMNGMAQGGTGPEADVSLTVTPQSDGDGWDLAMEIENFELFQPDGEAPDRPEQGHAHLYLNGLKLGRLYTGTASIGALLPGTYTVRVALNSNTHMPVMADGQPVEASAEITADQVLSRRSGIN